MVTLPSLGRTVAPQAVHVCEIVSVICDELHASLFIGWGTRLAIQCEGSKSMYADRLDYDRAKPEAGVDEPITIDFLAQAALASVKQWAADVNAFYNNELLKKEVYSLLSSWFEAGYQATNLEPAIESLTAFIDEAHKYNESIDRT